VLHATGQMEVGVHTTNDGLPASIPFSSIEAVLIAIGVLPRDCVSLTFDTDGVNIERVRTTHDGHVLTIGSGLATTTSYIPYDRSVITNEIKNK
jgi:hypothetical protein